MIEKKENVFIQWVNNNSKISFSIIMIAILGFSILIVDLVYRGMINEYQRKDINQVKEINSLTDTLNILKKGIKSIDLGDYNSKKDSSKIFPKIFHLAENEVLKRGNYLFILGNVIKITLLDTYSGFGQAVLKIYEGSIENRIEMTLKEKDRYSFNYKGQIIYIDLLDVNVDSVRLSITVVY